MNAKPISESRTSRGCGGLALVLFGSVFLAAGSAFFYFLVVSPTLKSRAAQDWPSAECQILDARIESHRDSEGTSYSAEFKYRYEVDGMEYTSETYSFVNFSGPHHIAKGLVANYPKGSQQICYYEPGNPSNVVLDRDNSNVPFWMSWFPLIFVVIGGGIIVAGFWGWFKGRGNSISGSIDADEAASNLAKSNLGFSGDTKGKPPKSGSGGLTEADLLDQQWSAPRKLKSTSSRLGVFLFLLLFATFWNGFIGIFLFKGPLFDGGFEFTSIFMILFMIPFVLVGIGLIIGVIYCFLALFNPKVEVALSSGAIPLGGEVDIAWEVDGKVERIKRLNIEIHAVQSATYTRGTDTVTDHEIFEKIPVVTVDSPTDIAFGSATVQIPTTTMHTFEAHRNKITWSIEVHGDIPMAPDISESFPFRVTPTVVRPNL